MPLTNQQYDAIMREYNLTQVRNRALTKERREEVYAAHPELLGLDNEIIDLSASSGVAIISGELSMEEYQAKLAQLNKERFRLLNSYGYPADYLDGVFDCRECKDTGYVNGVKCRCFNKRAIDMIYSQSNVKNRLVAENFNTFNLNYYSNDEAQINPTTNDTPYANMTKILSKAKAFVENFDKNYDNLLFYGGTGTGKTFLSNCIVDGLINSLHSVIYLTASELFDIFSSPMFRTTDIDEEITDSHYCLNCDLLVIDDLGTEVASAFTVSKLFYCLNERILRGKSTIISTNLSLRDLRDRYDERIFSRISSNYRILYFYGDDIRIKKKKMLNSGK